MKNIIGQWWIHRETVHKYCKQIFNKLWNLFWASLLEPVEVVWWEKGGCKISWSSPFKQTGASRDVWTSPLQNRFRDCLSDVRFSALLLEGQSCNIFVFGFVVQILIHLARPIIHFRVFSFRHKSTYIHVCNYHVVTCLFVYIIYILFYVDMSCIYAAVNIYIPMHAYLRLHMCIYT